MKTTILILILLLPVIASAEELVYDQNWNLKYRIEDGRIYDKNWQLKGNICWMPDYFDLKFLIKLNS